MIVVVAIGLLLLGWVNPTLGIALVAIAAIVEVVEVWLWIRYLRRRKVTTGVQAMIGETALVISPCRPEGSVRLRGEIWRANSPAGADVGERVILTAVNGLTLEVAPPAPPAVVQSSSS